jgi:hypothetical protein
MDGYICSGAHCDGHYGGTIQKKISPKNRFDMSSLREAATWTNLYASFGSHTDLRVLWWNVYRISSKDNGEDDKLGKISSRS